MHLVCWSPHRRRSPPAGSGSSRRPAGCGLPLSLPQLSEDLPRQTAPPRPVAASAFPSCPALLFLTSDLPRPPLVHPRPPGPATQSRPLLLPLPEGEAETAGPAPASTLLVPPAHLNLATCPVGPTKQEIPHTQAAGAGSAPGDQSPERSAACDPSLTGNFLLLSPEALPRSVLKLPTHNRKVTVHMHTCVFTKGVLVCMHVLQRVLCEVCAQAVGEHVCRKPHTALSQEAGWSPPRARLMCQEK